MYICSVQLTCRWSWMSRTEIAKLQRTMKQCHTFKVIFAVWNELWHSDVWPFFLNDAKCKVKLPLVPCSLFLVPYIYQYTLNTLPFHFIPFDIWVKVTLALGLFALPSLCFNSTTFVASVFLYFDFFFSPLFIALFFCITVNFLLFSVSLTVYVSVIFPFQLSSTAFGFLFFLHFYFVACQLVYIVDAIIATFITKRGKYVCQNYQKQTDLHFFSFRMLSYISVQCT